MKKRIVALLLCCVMLLTLSPSLIATATADDETTPAQTEVTVSPAKANLPRNKKVTLTAQAKDAKSYQWQIMAEDDLWVDISGETESTIQVSYAMVASLLNGSKAQLRCKTDLGTTDPATVTVTEAQAVAAAPAKAAPKAGTVMKGAEAINSAVVQASEGDAVANDETVTPSETTGDEPDTYTIVINYKFENGEPAANPWTATVAKGSSYAQDVTSPTVLGYAPNQATVSVDVKDAQMDTTYTVTYKPAEVAYTVIHKQQNVGDDDYTEFERETKKGYTESPVAADLAKKYDGFTALLYNTNATIAADGSTVVEIKYDRNYYLMKFDLDGGYGVEPIYARYGSTIEVGTPTKVGYAFDKWDPALPATMPAKSTTHTAQWTAGQATYLVQYWKENANDDGYSYESSAQKSAVVGSKVSGSDDKSYTGFTYNSQKTDTNVTVKGDGTTVVNVYYKRKTYTLTFKVNEGSFFENWKTKKTFKDVKYGEDTSKYWSQAPSGYLWHTSKDGNTFYTAAPDMPNRNLTIYGKQSTGSSTIHYYEKNTTKSIKADLTVRYANWDFTQEDYIAIPGFTFSDSSKNYDGTQYYIYYTRNSYKLDFNNRGTIVRSETIPYEESLTSYGKYIPGYPAGLEADAYRFDGWYTDPGCTVAVNWATATMPYQNTVLYAKWVPVTHTVKTWLTKDAMEKAEETIGNWTVPHGTMVDPAPAEPENGKYTFVGWFYMDDGVEKAFDFENMPVNKDLDLYAKWNANTLVTYTIRYVVIGEDGTEIAPPTTGSALAGTTKTFEAKTGTQLNEGYQTGYFPKTGSHSITMDINGNNEFTFIYVPRKTVNYTVRYLEKGTNAVLHEEKTAETSDAVITEKFVAITGYAPDAYQKRLVLGIDEDKNVITFWYVKDDVHAPVHIVHWIQNIEGDGYTKYQESTNLNGVIGTEYSETPLTIAGFEYKASPAHPVSGYPALASGKLTKAGLVLNLYYDRIEYPYEFRFLEQDTDKVLAAPVTGNARYQAQVTQTAKDIPGYTLVSAENQAINIAIEDPANVANKNVRTFYYTEQTVDIKYEVVGPTGCGTLDNYQESQLKVITGTPKGSTPTAATGFKFVGWFKDKDCTQPVDGNWVANNKLTPQKTKDLGNNVKGYEAATYYAKFDYDITDLTITKTYADGALKDPNQSAVFTVTDKAGFSIDVVIHGNGRVVIKGLKVGTTYTVTEKTGWTWRYMTTLTSQTSQNSQSIKLEATGNNEVTFTNTLNNNKWLTGGAWCDNVWGKSPNKSTSTDYSGK